MKIDKNNKFLLKEIILEHYQTPLYQKSEKHWSNKTKVFFNSFCGDKISFQIKVENDFIQDLSFSGHGCALAMAATDILCSQIVHQNFSTSLKILTNFYHLITGQVCEEDELGELIAFWTLPLHLNRVNCVLLPVNGLREVILENQGEKNGEKIKANGWTEANCEV